MGRKLHGSMEGALCKIMLSSLLLTLNTPFVHCGDDIYFSKISVEQGLSQFSVMTIYQDELGNMWFGTREGVNVYNGNSIRTFQPVLNDTNSLSGSLIKNICGDKNGQVYIHTQNGVNVFNLYTNALSLIENSPVDAITYDSGTFWLAQGGKIYRHQDGEKVLYAEITPDAAITVIKESSEGSLFIGTLSSGLFIINSEKEVEHLALNNSHVSSIFEDTNKNKWVGTWQNGLYRIDTSGTVFNYISTQSDGRSGISSDFVRAVCQDDNGSLWIGTKKGLDKLYIPEGVFSHYDSEGKDSRQLSNESIWSLYKDRQGTVWVGTYFGGVNYFNPNVNFYTFHNLEKGIFQNKPFPIISKIIETEEGTILLCTEGDGLLIYNPLDRTYLNLLKDVNIKEAYFDPDDRKLWLGLHLGGLCCIDLKSSSVEHFKDVRPGWEQSNIVRTILPFNGNFLIATYNGLFLFDKKTKKFTVFSEKIHEIVRYFVDVKIDRNDNLWIASRGVFCYNLKTGNFSSYFNDPANTSSLSNNNGVKILVDSRGKVWIATNGGGVNLYDENSDGFIHFDQGNSQLISNYVSNLLETPLNNLIVSTTCGFSIIDLNDNRITSYGPGNGLPLNSLFNGGMAVLKSGEIYMAGMNGMITFFEEDLFIPSKHFDLNFINLWVNNKIVTPGDITGILTNSVPFTQSISLNHRQSVLAVEFAVSNYIQANQPGFRYRLTGFSKDWIEIPAGERKLDFMNLKPDDYTLEVEALSPVDGTVAGKEELFIKVHPPFYWTWYAYSFYVLLLLFLIWRYVAFVKSKIILKSSLECEKREKENIDAANQSKLRFFTNISHEFRTPLTLIAGQVDMLLESDSIQPEVYNDILKIRRNTHTMQNLISELLEFRKIEHGDLKIRVCEVNIIDFLYEIYLSFQEYASYRKISLKFEAAEDQIPVWIDPVQMQKVYYNLISNAFKYTSQGGSIKISIEEEIENIIVSVSDDGIGITPDAIEKIFDQFYQSENGLQLNNMYPGTGIGLAFTKNILDVHKAEIGIESQPGTGTQFIVRLLKGSDHFHPEQKVEYINVDHKCLRVIEDEDGGVISFISESKKKGQENGSMLIVEDNAELRDMLKRIFEHKYHIYVAADGQEGLDMTLEHKPDIVLTDLMMPKMSGIDLCSRIKSDFSVCHIPVVLLTAQTAMEYNIEGLVKGADDYITKPFNVKTLFIRCNNLVNGRKVLQHKFSKTPGFLPSALATNEMDSKFLDTVCSVIEKNIDNPDFDVTAFSREMAIGRTRLFDKIKGITGNTPNEFIISIKMKKASSLLLDHPELNISEIAYRLGFSSPKYFSKCFKTQFGFSPSEFRGLSVIKTD